MALTVNRRQLTGGLLGLIAISAAGVGCVMSYEIADYIWQALFRMLGDFDMAEADMAAFSDDFTRPIDLEGWTGWMLRAGGLSHMDGYLTATGPPGIHERFEGFDRSLLGAFILSTNFLDVYEQGRGTVVYYGPNVPCSNPFSKFDPVS